MSNLRISVTLNTCGQDIEYVEVSVPSEQIEGSRGFFTHKVKLYPTDIQRLAAVVNIFNSSKTDR